MTHSFRLLKELIFCLTTKELSLLKKKFEVNVESSDKNKIKSKDLLQSIRTFPEITQKELERKLYGNSNRVAFAKLIDRAIEKIDEVLIAFSRDAISIYSE